MTRLMTIEQNETGVVRVFVLNRPSDMPRGQEIPIGQIGQWLRAGALNAADVQQIWTDDLVDDLGLPELLAAGYGIDQAQIAAQAERLDAMMEAHPTVIVIIRSGGFAERPVTLHDDGPLALVADFREPGASVSFEPLPNPDPAPAIGDAPQKKRPSDAAMSGRIATVALLVMGLLVWLMIWVAG